MMPMILFINNTSGNLQVSCI